MISKKKEEALQKKILSWYKQNKRNLPWRKTRVPYAILVSEVMLQQTQVERVIPYFNKWMKTFPTSKTLSKAKKATVLKMWSGLGFNNRVLRLQKTAFEISAKQSFPETEKELITLPGIGPYTARAILAFAFNKDVPVIDTNIRRILIHELNLKEDISMQSLENIAKELIPKGKSRIWHNALMDYGALHLTTKKTGISPLTKQTTFKGSDREVRGFILKTLVNEKKLSIAKIKKQFPKKDVAKISAEMISEGLVRKEKQTLKI